MGVLVLIVDDSDAIRFLHEVIVAQSELCMKPLSFGSGEAALDYLDQHCGETEIYLILLDINMPGLSGWEVLDAMMSKDYRNRVYIILVTSSVDKRDHERAKLYEMVVGFVEKPITVQRCKWIIHSSPMAQYY